MSAFRRSMAALALLAALGAAGAAFALSGSQAVQMRRATFDEMAQVLQFAARNWRDSTAYPDIARAARIIERDAKNLSGLFPAGTGAGDGYRTAALDSIWTDRPGFDQLVKQLTEQAAGMTGVDGSTSEGEIKQGLVGMIGTCKACHRDYRAN